MLHVCTLHKVASGPIGENDQRHAIAKLVTLFDLVVKNSLVHY